MRVRGLSIAFSDEIHTVQSTIEVNATQNPQTLKTKSLHTYVTVINFIHCTDTTWTWKNFNSYMNTKLKHVKSIDIDWHCSNIS